MLNLNRNSSIHLEKPKKALVLSITFLMIAAMVIPAMLQVAKAEECIDEDPFSYSPDTYSTTVSPGGSTNATITLGLQSTGVTLTYPVTTTGWATISGLPSGWTVTPNVTTYSWASGSATVAVNLTVYVPAGASPNTYTFTAILVPGKDSATSPTHTVGAGTGVAFSITVPSLPTNVKPTAAFTWSPETPDEGALVTFTDQSTQGTGAIDSWSWTFGDGGTSNDQNPTHTFVDNGVYTVTLEVTDENDLSNSVSHDITVNNVAPTVGAITILPSAVVQVNTIITASASFTDPGILDWHTASWDWDYANPGTQTSTGTVTPAAPTPGDGSVTDSHTYTVAGIYTVNLTVTDKDGGIGNSTFEYVVVYDPSAGFATGGGWIDSPAGAYKADLTLAGKATFGFVSKYLKGATIPTGNTEFQFHAGDLNFKSTSYQWLVVTGGNTAQYKGVGTINGEGSYNFMIWAKDGGAKGVDTFRILITDSSDNVVYDNGVQQSISGSIVVHK